MRFWRSTVGSAKRWWGLALVAVVVAVICASGGSALAVVNTGMFELDGNVVHDAGTTPPYDWASLFGATGSRLVTPDLVNGPLLASTFLSDTALLDGSYFSPTVQDTQAISNWGCASVNNPTDNVNLSNAYAALVRVPANAPENAGHTVGLLGSERGSNNGTSYAGFWLLQDGNVGCNSMTGSFSGSHVVGDLLVVADYTNGGGASDVSVYEWVGGTTPLSLLESGSVCPTGSENLCGIANPSTIATPWQPTSHTSNTFVETGVDLTALFAGVEGNRCFSRLLAETRSSNQTAATLQDFAISSFDTCPSPSISTQIEVTGTGGLGTTSLGDQATLAGFQGAPSLSDTVTFRLWGPYAAGVTPTCTGTPVFTTTGALSGLGSAVATTSQTYTPTAVGTYVWTASFSGNGSNGAVSEPCNGANESGTVVGSELAVAKAADPPGPVSAGDTVGFDITVSNPSAAPALNATVDDNLPPGQDLNWSLSPAYPGCSINGAPGSQTLHCSVGTIPGTTTLPAIHVSSLTSDADCGVVSNQAAVSTTNGTGGDSETASVTVVCAPSVGGPTSSATGATSSATGATSSATGATGATSSATTTSSDGTQGGAGSAGGNGTPATCTVRVPAVQRKLVKRVLTTTVACDRSATVTETATLTTGAAAKRAKRAKPIALGATSATVGPGAPVTVGLKLARRADAALLRAIRRHRRFRVGVSITATAAGGATSTAAAATRKIKLAKKAVGPRRS